jgi:hypothetical protein
MAISIVTSTNVSTYEVPQRPAVRYTKTASALKRIWKMSTLRFGDGITPPAGWFIASGTF